VKTTARESTTRRLVADDPDRKLLPIEFHNRALYPYFNVPADSHEGLFEAPSRGTCCHRLIRQKFAYPKMKTIDLS